MTVELFKCSSAEVSEKTTVCLLTLLIRFDKPLSYPVIPVNPRTHPINVVEVLLVYVIISLSIFRRP